MAISGLLDCVLCSSTSHHQVEAVLKNPVESETVLSLSNTAKNLHKEYLQLKMEVEKRFIEFQPLMQQVKPLGTHKEIIIN